jgi:hypothetical protein
MEQFKLLVIFKGDKTEAVKSASVVLFPLT